MQWPKELVRNYNTLIEFNYLLTYFVFNYKFIIVFVLLETILFSAVCLDGSPPAYHWDKGFGTGINSWLIHFEVCVLVLVHLIISYANKMKLLLVRGLVLITGKLVLVFDERDMSI